MPDFLLTVLKKIGVIKLVQTFYTNLKFEMATACCYKANLKKEKHLTVTLIALELRKMLNESTGLVQTVPFPPISNASAKELGEDLLLMLSPLPPSHP